MTKAKLAIIISLSVVGAGGVATGTAFIIKGATKSTSDNVDDSIILNWNSESNFNEITGLSYGNAQYRTISLEAPTIIGTVDASAVFYCSIEPQSECSLEGLEIGISKTQWLDETVAISTLSSTNTSYKETITEETTFYLKISITEASYNSYIAEGATTTFGANIKLAYKAVANV